jgi:hypothetical protein
VEKDYAVLNRQLKGDLSEKTNLIKQLSSQLDTHQANFNELKQELSKVIHFNLIHLVNCCLFHYHSDTANICCDVQLILAIKGRLNDVISL